MRIVGQLPRGNTKPRANEFRLSPTSHLRADGNCISRIIHRADTFDFPPTLPPFLSLAPNPLALFPTAAVFRYVPGRIAVAYFRGVFAFLRYRTITRTTLYSPFSLRL